MNRLFALVIAASSFSSVFAQQDLQILFLGDQGHHQPRARAEQLIPVLQDAGIQVTYSDAVSDLNRENLKRYAGLIVYANIDRIEPAQEAALLEYVSQGGGFIPLHCASYCFRNSAAVVDLIGAQFQKHGGEVFHTEIVQPEHPIMQGFNPFESWDETYVHTRHNERNRVVLEVRRLGEQAEGRTEEPWTWIRTHGEGRVFYTAWGHDERTWGHAGFQNLVERGIRWACGDDPAKAGDYSDPSVFAVPRMTPPRLDVARFEYQDVGPKIPNYLAGERWGTQGEIITKMQKPLPPVESMKHYVTPENFHLELFVSEPQLAGKPIAMNWDHRGRLWVCETVDYPNELMPPGQGRDRIRICEDTDRDGKADKFTVFAEDLSIPSSIEFCHGGVIVQADVETLYLRDNDGDDRADERRVLISGWAMGDTHGGVSNFQYGLDNRYWAMQGYNNSRPQFAGGEHPGFRMGPFAFSIGGPAARPEVSEVEFIRSTTNNSWGLGTSEEGLVFASTANRAPSFFVPVPNRYYERVRGWAPSLVAEAIAPDHYFQPITSNYRQVDHHGGYTAGAGHAIYTARTYPRSWWNRTAFVCGPTGHLVGTFVLTRDGATFRDRNLFNLVASDDEWSAPIMAEVGPDGNVWIIDWYNYIVQHNPTPRGFETGKGNAYESDLRDKTHGRIYRLVYDGDLGQAGADQYATLDQDDPGSLTAGLAHSNRLWRRHAQRLLVERQDQAVVPELIRLGQDPTVDAVQNNAGVVHALWTLKGLGSLNQASGPAFELAVASLSHEAGGVRRNAALVLPSHPASTEAILASGILTDVDAQVRLAALMALADMPRHAAAGRALAQLALNNSTRNNTTRMQRIDREAIICASAAHAVEFLSSLFTSEGAHLEAQDDLQHMVEVIAGHVARSGIDSESLNALLADASSDGTPLRQPFLQGLASGWPVAEKPVGGQINEQLERSLLKLLDSAEPSELGPLLKLGAAWGSTQMQEHQHKMIGSLLSNLRNGDEAVEQRLSAARNLVSFAGTVPQTIADLVNSLDPQMPPQLASGIVRSLSDSTAPNVAKELIGNWSSLTPSLRNDAIVVLLSRRNTTGELLDAMEAGLQGRESPISTNDLALEQRQTLLSHPSRDIRRRASRLLASTGSLVNADRQRVIETYSAATSNIGNAAKGKLLFAKNCANCHLHSGEGNDIGPELTGMAVHPKDELIIHILDPSRSVEGNFRRYTLLTAGGQIMSGMLAAESLSAVELINAEGKRLSIVREDIEDIKASDKSMMPEGFEQQLSVSDMTDLLEFLTSKGKFVPLPLASVATAISTRGLFTDSNTGADRLVASQWGKREFNGIPFQLTSPLDDVRPNIVLLNGPRGMLPPKMPRSVSMPCNMVIKNLHFLSGVSGWGYPAERRQTVSMTVRLRYEDGETEDHPLLNGVHFADYIRRVDVPGSTFAFALRAQQIRYLSVQPRRRSPILAVELIKGNDPTAPIVMAITAEQYE